MSERQLELILASRSPRRCELLAAAGYRFKVRQPSKAAERGSVAGLSAEQLVARLAYRKAADVADKVRQGLILGCDTVAECDGQVLGKPADEDHARQMLHSLRGREHHVYSGLCLWKSPEGRSLVRVAVTRLRMDPLGNQQIADYLASGQWKSKAGAFGYQDRTGWVHVIEGSESNVVGLPMELLSEMLAKFES